MGPIHEDISKYMMFMRAKRYLNNYENQGFIVKCRKIYFHFRPALLLALLGVNIYGLSGVEKMGLLDGSFIFVAVNISVFVLTSISYVKHPEHLRLVMSLNRNILEHNDSWMVTIQEKYSQSAWKIADFLLLWNNTSCYLYALGPLFVDTVLHYGLNWLETPLFLPGSFTPFFDSDVTWDAKYYTLTLLGMWSIWELISVQQGFIVGYLLLSDAYLIELVIFKEKVKSLKLEEAQQEIDLQFRTITEWHKEIMA